MCNPCKTYAIKIAYLTMIGIITQYNDFWPIIR